MGGNLPCSKFFRQERVLALALPKSLEDIVGMIELQTTKDVIDALGGTSGIAELTDAKPKAISMWRTLGRFPWKTYPVITAALRVKGKTAPESLFGMKAKETAA
jgi:hypothetical protein